LQLEATRSSFGSSLSIVGVGWFIGIECWFLITVSG
jgi:hypothetical protein